jgi:hypothetical protein
MPLDLLGHEADEAVRLGISAIDLRQELLKSLPAAATFVPLDSDRILQMLDAIAGSTNQGNCVLVYTLDLLLAQLSHQQRTDFWQFAYQGFDHRPCALLLGIPATASSLLPASSMLFHWADGERFVSSP